MQNYGKYFIIYKYFIYTKYFVGYCHDTFCKKNYMVSPCPPDVIVKYINIQSKMNSYLVSRYNRRFNHQLQNNKTKE